MWMAIQNPKITEKQKKQPRAENQSNTRSGLFNLFAISGRIAFICMKYGRQWVRVIFMRYVWPKNSYYPVYVKSRIVFIRKLFVTSLSRLFRIVSTDSLAFRLFCSNIRQHGRQILYFE